MGFQSRFGGIAFGRDGHETKTCEGAPAGRRQRVLQGGLSGAAEPKGGRLGNAGPRLAKGPYGGIRLELSRRAEVVTQDVENARSF